MASPPQPRGGHASAPVLALLGLLSLRLTFVSAHRVLASSDAPLMVFDAGVQDHVSINAAGDAWTITLDKTGTARLKSPTPFAPPFTISALVKPAGGQATGVVSSFYISSLEGSTDQDEIDFEWKGRDVTSASSSSAQLNYFVDGVGGNELVVPIGGDANVAYHNYTLFYGTDALIWYLDGTLVRQVDKATAATFPSKPGYVYSSIWDASQIDNGRWAGSTDNLANAPYTIQVKSASIRKS